MVVVVAEVGWNNLQLALRMRNDHQGVWVLDLNLGLDVLWKRLKIWDGGSLRKTE